jgi:hypothetical protein
MASRLSDIFSSDDNNQDSSANAHGNQNADQSGEANNDGVSVSNESSSTDEDGNSQSDSTGVDVGGTNLAGDSSVTDMIHGATDSMSSSDGTDILDS